MYAFRSAICTVMCLFGLLYCTPLPYMYKKYSECLMLGEILLHPDHDAANHVLKLLLTSHTTTLALIIMFLVHFFILIVMCLKRIFFVKLDATEYEKFVERFVHYVIFKGVFLPSAVPLTLYQAGLWSTWLSIVCALKMFQTLARDRLERLNASFSTTPWTYFRVYCVLLLVLAVDTVWIRMCMVIYQRKPCAVFSLLFYEPLSIAFDTLQAILVLGFQFLDIWLHHSTGSLWDYWKTVISRGVGFLLVIMSLLMAVGHYVHIWRLSSMPFGFLILYLHVSGFLGAIVRCTKEFIESRLALGSFRGDLAGGT